MKKIFVVAFIATMCLSANSIMNAENYSTDQLLSYSASSNYKYVTTIKPYKKNGSLKITNNTSFDVYTDNTYYYVLIDGQYVRANYDSNMQAYSFYWRNSTWYFNA